MKRCHGRLPYDRKFQIFIFLIRHNNVNKGVFCLIISYLQIKSYNVLNYTVFWLGFQKGRALLLKRALLSVNVDWKRTLYFWIVFTIKLKRNNLRHELKKYMLKRVLISLKYFRPLWMKLLKKKNYIKWSSFLLSLNSYCYLNCHRN